jgi:hypothetical protein
MSEELKEGHGRTDVSCRHGSRWAWWPGRDDKGDWRKVVWASNCDCGDPPRPDKKEAIRLNCQKPVIEVNKVGHCVSFVSTFRRKKAEGLPDDASEGTVVESLGISSTMPPPFTSPKSEASSSKGEDEK